MPYIGEKLKELRLEKKMTQEQLAKALGLSKSAIVQYEHNKREPNSDSLIKIENFFKVSTLYLAGKSQYKRISEDMFYTDNIQSSAVFHNANETIQRKVIMLVNSFDYFLKNTLKQDSIQNKEVIFNNMYSVMSLIFSTISGDLKEYPEMYEGELLDKLSLYKLQEKYYKSNISEMERTLKELFDLNFDRIYDDYCMSFSGISSNKEYIKMIQDVEEEISQQKS